MSKLDNLKSSKKRKLTSTQETEVVEPAVEDSAPLLPKKENKEKKAKKASKKNEPAEADVAMKVDAAQVEEEQEAKQGEGEADQVEEAPAMSHKALRLAKRRKLAGLDPLPLPTSTTSTDTLTNPTSSANPNPIVIGQTPTKSAHGIWVGNLSFKTTGKILLDWFADRGLKDVTRLNLPGGKRALEFNRGFAYIDFPTPTDVEIAVGLSEQHLDGRKLLIKSSTDYTGRPLPTSNLPSTSSLDPSSLTPSETGVTLNKTARKILDRQKNQPGPTLFVGNLGFETTVDDIRGMFDAHQRGVGGWDKKEKVVKADKTEKGKGADEEEGEEVKENGGDEDDEDPEKEEGAEDDEEREEASDSDSERDEDEETKVKAKRPKDGGPKGPLDLSKAKDAGIRKVRLGTFEDSGKCKGWAFIDFHLPTQATRALLNVHNHTLNGRSLVLEYASAEAVRRGGLGTKAGGGGGGDGAKGGRGAAARERGSAEKVGPRGLKKRAREWDDEDVVESAKRTVASSSGDGAAGDDGGERKGRSPGRGGSGAGGAAVPKRPQQGRAKPGAALASAQRASEAIVESRGKKITFD